MHVRPAERAASELTDRLIRLEEERSAGMRDQTHRMEVASGMAILIFAIAATAMVTRRLWRRLSTDVLAPLQGVTEALSRLAEGQRGVIIPGKELANEIGDIARAAKVFKERTALVERLNVFMTVTSNTIIVADRERRIIFWNPAAEDLLGWTAEEALGELLDIVIPKRDLDAHYSGFAKLLDGTATRLLARPIETPALCKDGTEIAIEVVLGVWQENDGINLGLIVRDLTERNLAEAERSRTAEMLDAIVESMPVSLFVKDASEHRLRLVNRAYEVMTGRDRQDLIDRSDADLFPPDQAAHLVARDRAVLDGNGLDVSEELITRADGAVRVLRTRKLGIGGVDGRPRLLLGMSEDITDTVEAQQRIHHMAHHDALTGLPNRFSFNERLAGVLADDQQCGAVLSIDLDRFKAVNDVHGHPIGDRVLSEVASRLRETLAEHFVARIGGDEFEAIALGVYGSEQARQLGELVIAALCKPIVTDGIVIHLGSSVGIAMLPDDGEDADTLMRNADLALYKAKGEGRGICRFFEPEMDRLQREQRGLEDDLREALAAGQIVPHYQPLFDLASGGVSGFEALARWTHPQRGSVSPDVFIPIAESAGLILELGRQVLAAVVEEAATWEPPLTVAVNLSPLQVQSGSLVQEVTALLTRTGLAATRLELEITENVLIRDTKRAVATLRELKALGVRIAMDDFGTGYSSLSYFSLFPFDKVKIDQSFVRDMADNPQALAVVKAVIRLGHGLSLPVVAEGVETDLQLATLREEGCDQVQGYLTGSANPIEYFETVIIKRTRTKKVVLITAES